MAPHSLARLTAPVLAVSVLLLISGVGAAWYVHRFQRVSSDLLEVNVASVRAAEELEIAARELRSQLVRLLITGERKHLDAMPALREDALDRLREAERTASTPYEFERMAAARAACDHFFAELDRLTRPPRPDGLTWEVYSAMDRVLADEILPPVHDYLKYNERALYERSRENRELSDRLAWVFLALGVCGAGAGLAAGFGMAVALRRSIVQVQVRLEDTAGRITGQLRPVNVTPTSGDDLGKLDAAARHLADSITNVLDRLQQTRSDAQRAEQLAAVGQMAAGIAHEVRNPLTAIKVLVQAASERGDDGHIRGRHLRVLEEEVTRLERLIGTFLDFARPPRPEKRRVDLTAALRETLVLLNRRAELQGVRIRTVLPPSSADVEADPDQLRQLLFNLLHNALEASAAGAEVEVALESRPGAVELTVRDRGPGLPPKLGEQIFEPFVSTKETGLGLGLSISRRIVEAHGGTLRAADRPGGGAEFAATLPASAAG